MKNIFYFKDSQDLSIDTKILIIYCLSFLPNTEFSFSSLMKINNLSKERKERMIGIAFEVENFLTISKCLQIFFPFLNIKFFLPFLLHKRKYSEYKLVSMIKEAISFGYLEEKNEDMKKTFQLRKVF